MDKAYIRLGKANGLEEKRAVRPKALMRRKNSRGEVVQQAGRTGDWDQSMK